MRKNFKLNICNYLDKFAIDNSLYLDRKEKDNICFGLVLTIIYLGTILIIFFIYLIDIILKKNPEFTSSTEYSIFPEIKLNNDLLYFYFSLQDPITNNEFIDETIYYPEAKFISKRRENGIWVNNEQNIEIEVCNISKFGKKYQNMFKDKPLNSVYCFKEINYTLQGSFAAGNWAYIDINIYPCTNNTKNNTCKSQEIITKSLTNSYITVQLENIGINLDNFKIPVLPIIEDIYTSVSLGIYRYYNLYLQITDIQTDVGIFNYKIKKERYLKVDKHNEI